MDFIFFALNRLIWIYSIMIVVYALLSWFPGAQESKLGQFIGRLVAPFVNLFNFASFGGIGFGPVIAIIVLDVILNLLSYLQAMLGM